MTATDVSAPAALDPDDRAALRSSVADLLVDRCTDADVRRVMDTAEGYDPGLWQQLAGELGVVALAVPADLGGAGATFEEVALVHEELGRALCPGPFLATTVAAYALTEADDERARSDHLPAIAAGKLLATVALDQPGSAPGGLGVTADATGTLHGVSPYVLDGHLAELLVVVARAGSEPGVFVVEPGSAGTTATPLDLIDRTRRLARVELDGVPSTRIGGPALADRLLDVASVALASEQVGGADATLAAAVDYAKVRTQFGRPIGSFQAVKHKCADMFLAIESGKAIARRAARELAGRGGETAVLASVAKAWCSETYTGAAADNVQIHGGVGFTWEHSAHLRLRRAKTDEMLFGDARHHRERLAGLLGI